MTNLRRIILIYLTTSLMLIFVLGMIGSVHERSIEVKVFQKEIDSYRHLLLNFMKQDWSLIAIRNNAPGAIIRELERFSNSKTKCVKFYYSEREVGQFGNCLLVTNENLKLGWNSMYGNLILFEKFREDISFEAFLDNSEGYTINEGNIELPIQLKHFKSSYVLIIIGCFVFNLIFFVSLFIIYIRKQKLNSENKIHDFINVLDDSQAIGEELEQNAFKPQAILVLAHKIKSISSLREASLYDGPQKDIQLYSIDELIKELTSGFFANRDQSVLSIGPYNPKIYFRIDKRILYRALVNLFDNAFYEVIGKSTFTLTILDSPNSVEFVVSNKSKLRKPHKLFKSGISGRRSTGKGLGIVEEMVSSLGSKIYLTYSDENVSFSFSVPKSMEESCAAFYA